MIIQIKRIAIGVTMLFISAFVLFVVAGELEFAGLLGVVGFLAWGLGGLMWSSLGGGE